MTRRESREQAFALLFEKSFHEESTVEELANGALDARDVGTSAFAMQLAKGAESHLEAVDGKIGNYSHKWKKDRISRVALAVLRIAVYEILYEKDIPESVSINEAVELAKKYGGEDDFSFVNGILGSLSRELVGQEPS